MVIYLNGNKMSSNLPPGAENDPRAPWNEKKPELVKVEVELSIILSKKVKLVLEEGYTPNQVFELLKEYVDDWLSKEKDKWEVSDIDYEIIK